MIDSDGKNLLEATGRLAATVLSKINGLSNIRMNFIGLPFRLGDCTEVATALSVGVYSGDKSGAAAFLVEEAGDIYSKIVVDNESIATKAIKISAVDLQTSDREYEKELQTEKTISLVSKAIKTAPAILATVSVQTLETSKTAGEIYARSGSVSGAVLESLIVPAIVLFSSYVLERWNEQGKKQEKLEHAKTATGQNQSADKHYGRDSR